MGPLHLNNASKVIFEAHKLEGNIVARQGHLISGTLSPLIIPAGVQYFVLYCDTCINLSHRTLRAAQLNLFNFPAPQSYTCLSFYSHLCWCVHDLFPHFIYIKQRVESALVYKINCVNALEIYCGGF
jgi:hypothetical protein